MGAIKFLYQKQLSDAEHEVSEVFWLLNVPSYCTNNPVYFNPAGGVFKWQTKTISLLTSHTGNFLMGRELVDADVKILLFLFGLFLFLEEPKKKS